MEEIYEMLPEGIFNDFNGFSEYVNQNGIKSVYEMLPEGIFNDEQGFLDYAEKKNPIVTPSNGGKVVTESTTETETTPGSSDGLEVTEVVEDDFVDFKEQMNPLNVLKGDTENLIPEEEVQDFLTEDLNKLLDNSDIPLDGFYMPGQSRARAMKNASKIVDETLKLKIEADPNIQKALAVGYIKESDVISALKGNRKSIEKLQDIAVRSTEDNILKLQSEELQPYDVYSETKNYIETEEDKAIKTEAIRVVNSFNSETQKLLDANPDATEEEMQAIFQREGSPTQEQFDIAEDADYQPTGFENEQLGKMYNQTALKKLSDKNEKFNIAGFNGYLKKKGFLDKYNQLLEDETISEDGRSYDYSGNYNPTLAAERLKYDYLKNYLAESDMQRIEKEVLEYKIANNGRNPFLHGDTDKINLKPSIKSEDLSQYMIEEFKTLAAVVEKQKAETKENYQRELEGGVGGDNTQWLLDSGYQGGRSVADRINSTSEWGYGWLGMDSVVDEIQMNQAETELNRDDMLRYTYASGKSAYANGREYMIDDRGEIYDLDLKIRVSSVLEPSQIEEIRKQVSKNGVETSSFSGTGAAVTTAGVASDMLLQIALTRGVGIAGQTIKGISAASKYKQGRSIIKLLEKVPMRATTASAMIAQGTLMASSLSSDVRKQALAAGMSNEEADELAASASMQGYALGVLTAPISTQRIAMDKIFGTKVKEKLIQKSIDAYTKGAGIEVSKSIFKKGLDKVITNGKVYLGEGLKEFIQENIQQGGQAYVIGDNINEQAGQEIMRDTISADEFMNTSIISLTAGFFMPFAGDLKTGTVNSFKVRGRGFQAVDQMKALALMSSDSDKTKQLLDSQVKKGVYTPEQVENIMADVEIYKSTINGLPPNLSAETSLSVMSDLAKIKELEAIKQKENPAFPDFRTDVEIQKLKNRIIKKSNFDFINNKEKQKFMDNAGKELVAEKEAAGEKNYKINNSEIRNRAVENFNKLSIEEMQALAYPDQQKESETKTDEDAISKPSTEEQVTVTQSQKDLFGETHTDKNLITPSNPKGEANISNITSLDGKGVSTATYVNPETGIVDAIISSKDKKNFVGYVRIYENGKPTNMFSTKMESTGGAFKNMITSADTTLPDGAKVLPGETISEGGLKSFNNSKLDVETDSDGNVVTREVNYSDVTKETVKQKGDRSFGKFVTPIKSEAEAEIVKIQKAYPGIEARIVKSGLSFEIKIDLPVLIKTEKDAIQEPSTEKQVLPDDATSQTDGADSEVELQQVGEGDVGTDTDTQVEEGETQTDTTSDTTTEGNVEQVAETQLKPYDPVKKESYETVDDNGDKAIVVIITAKDGSRKIQYKNKDGETYNNDTLGKDNDITNERVIELVVSEEGSGIVKTETIEGFENIASPKAVRRRKGNKTTDTEQLTDTPQVFGDNPLSSIEVSEDYNDIGKQRRSKLRVIAQMEFNNEITAEEQLNLREDSFRNMKKAQEAFKSKPKTNEKTKQQVQSKRSRDGGTRRTSISKTTPLQGTPVIKGATGPDIQLVSVAEKYANDNNIELKRQGEYVEVDPVRAKRIADAYTEMANDPQNPKVKEAYAELIKQTKAQYEALVKAGYKFWFIDLNNPKNIEYISSPFNAMRDLRKNKEMGVFPTDLGFGSDEDVDVSQNPLLEDTGLKWPVGGLNGETKSVTANDLFRAVHDAFGHGLEGAGFRARGEENAWQAHSRLFTGAAIGAMTSETRGQNSWVNFGPNGESNRTASAEDTVFADQKVGLMPEWTWSEGRSEDMQSPKVMSVNNDLDNKIESFANRMADADTSNELSDEAIEFYSENQEAIDKRVSEIRKKLPKDKSKTRRLATKIAKGETNFSNEQIDLYAANEAEVQAEVEAIAKTNSQTVTADTYKGILKSIKSTTRTDKARQEGENAQRKRFWKAWNKANREGKQDLKTKRKNLNDQIKTYAKGKKGTITAAQTRAVVNRVNSVNLDNELAVQELIDYSEKIFNNADFAVKEAQAIKLNSDVTKKLNSGAYGLNTDLNTRLSNILNTPISNLTSENIDSYNDFLKRIKNSKKSELAPFILEAQNLFDSLYVATPEVSEEVETKEAETLKNIVDKIIDEDVDGETLLKDNSKFIENDLGKLDSFELETLIDKINLAETDENTDIVQAANNYAENRQKVLNNIKSRSKGITLKNLDTTTREAGDVNVYKNIKDSDIVGLTGNQLMELEITLENINEGFYTHAANKLGQSINSRAQDIMPMIMKYGTGKHKAAMIKTFGESYLKSKYTGKGVAQEMIRSNPLSVIDNVFGNYANENIRNNTFTPIASKYAAYNAWAAKATDKLAAVEKLLAPSLKESVNKSVERNFEVQMYLLALESESNPGVKGIDTPNGYVSAVVKKYNKNPQKSRYNESDIAVLEAMLKKYNDNGVVTTKKMDESLSPKVKKAIKIMRDVYNSLSDKQAYATTIVRGGKLDLLNNYVHHKMDVDTKGFSENRDQNDSQLQSQMNYFNSSTKSKTSISRTGVSNNKSIDFSPVSSALRAVRAVGMDYYLTNEIQTERKALNELIKITERNTDRKEVIQAAKDLNEVYTEAIDNVIGSNFSTDVVGGKLMDVAKRIGYYGTLASVPRAVAELGSNLTFALLDSPLETMDGMTKYGKLGLGQNGMDFAINVGAISYTKLYNSEILSGSKAEQGGVVRNKKTSSRTKQTKLGEGIEYAGRFTSQGAKGIEFVADNLLSTPDKMISRPLFFGTFGRTFKSITGQEMDVNKISENDQEYMEKYADAIKESRIAADKAVTQAATSNDPFSGVLKNQLKAGAGNTGKNYYRTLNSYMARFTINEYATARQAIASMVGQGDQSPIQGAAKLTAVMARMSLYVVSYKALTALWQSMLGLDDEDDVDYEELAIRQAVGAGVSLITRGVTGNIPQILPNIGIESFNKSYGEELGLWSDDDGKGYNQYKHSLIFSIINTESIERKGAASALINVLSGPLSNQVNASLRVADLLAKMDSKNATVANRAFKEFMSERTAIEMLNIPGAIPFYKDVRRYYVAKNWSEVKEAKRLEENKGKRLSIKQMELINPRKADEMRRKKKELKEKRNNDPKYQAILRAKKERKEKRERELRRRRRR